MNLPTLLPLVDTLAAILGLMGGLNTFGYVGQSPLGLFDILGLLDITSFTCDKDEYGKCEAVTTTVKRSDWIRVKGTLTKGKVFADDGITTVTVYKAAPGSDPGIKLNCHGCAYANCEFWIQGDRDTIDSILRGDGYDEVLPSSRAPGDKVKFDTPPTWPCWWCDPAVEHSATITDVDENGTKTIQDNAADDAMTPGTMEDSAKEYGGPTSIWRKR